MEQPATPNPSVNCTIKLPTNTQTKKIPQAKAWGKILSNRRVRNPLTGKESESEQAATKFRRSVGLVSEIAK